MELSSIFHPRKNRHRRLFAYLSLSSCLLLFGCSQNKSGAAQKQLFISPALLIDAPLLPGKVPEHRSNKFVSNLAKTLKANSIAKPNNIYVILADKTTDESISKFQKQLRTFNKQSNGDGIFLLLFSAGMRKQQNNSKQVTWYSTLFDAIHPLKAKQLIICENFVQFPDQPVFPPESGFFPFYAPWPSDLKTPPGVKSTVILVGGKILQDINKPNFSEMGYFLSSVTKGLQGDAADSSGVIHLSNLLHYVQHDVSVHKKLYDSSLITPYWVIPPSQRNTAMATIIGKGFEPGNGGSTLVDLKVHASPAEKSRALVEKAWNYSLI